MASVTQKVPNYVLGISTQPDEKKIPGQVTDLVNGVPDVVNQLTKRPGSQLVNTLTPSTSDHAKWFSIYTATDEQYIGQVAPDGATKIWRCSDGVEIPVDYALIPGTNKATYLDNTELLDEKSSDIQALTINETTFFVNRRKNTAMKTGTGDLSPAQLNEAFISLDTITYGKQYALDIFDPDNNDLFEHTRATSIEVQTVSDSNDYSGTSNGDCLGMGREIVDISVGTDMFSTSPPNMNAGGNSRLRYEMDIRCTPQPTAPVDASYSYHDTYQAFAKLQFGGEGWLSTVPDTHQYTSEKGVTTTVKILKHTTIKSRCNIAGVRPEATSSTSEEHVSSAIILSNIKTTLDAISGTGITCTICGNGIHLYRATPFGVTTPEKSLMSIATSEVNNIAELPRNCRHGYIVRVVNSGEDMDDYYLRFQAEGIKAEISKAVTYSRTGSTVTVYSTAHGLVNGDTVFIDFTSGGAGDGHYTVSNVSADEFDLASNSSSGTIAEADANTCTYTPARFGEGVWEEVAAPGIEITLDKDTMPLKLTRINASTQHTIATSAVNTTSKQFTITDHGMLTGDRILYDNAGGTNLAGLTDDTVYYVIKIDANTIRLATSSANATAGFPWIQISGVGNNAQTLTHGPFAINGGAESHYANGAFRFDYPDWGERDVGDDVTNSKPSFIGYPIQKMLFFRNRIALLSTENVILSRVNDYYSFWVKTAMAISNADPIDLQSSSKFPTKLYDAIETAGGLVIFSASEQFLLSSGAEALLTPETAKIGYLSSYSFNPDTVPLSLGTTIGFLNSTARQARFYEMANVSATEEPQVNEQTKIVGDIFPQSTTLVSGSTENDILLFAVDSTLHTATNEVWGYKWFEAGQKRSQSAWFRWTMPNNVIYHTILDDVYYAVLNTGSTFTLEKFDVKLTSDTPMIGTAPDENRVHLDTKKTIASSAMTYNDQEDFTTFVLGTGYYSSNTLTVYCIQSGNSAGRSYDIPTIHIDKTFAASAVDTSAETITIASHTLVTGNPVTYQEGSSAVGGLTDNTVYYVIKVDDDTIKLATTRTNANADTAINLTSQGGGTHTLETPTVTLPGNWKYEKQTFNHTANTSSNVDNITVNHVDTTAETITLANHNLTTGDAVVYKAPTTTGGSTVGGLSDGTTYYAIVVDSTTIKLATSSANATAGTAVNLTATGQGTSTLQVLTSLIVGYEYEFEVELPKLYVTSTEGQSTKSETRGSLVIHRMNFDFGDVGVIDVTLKRRGRDDYTYTVESLEWDNVLSSTAAIAKGYMHTIPVYDRNENLTVLIKSNHPSPATIHSMNWEGDYSPRYYRSV